MADIFAHNVLIKNDWKEMFCFDLIQTSEFISMGKN